jgi:hypothetical protein
MKSSVVLLILVSEITIVFAVNNTALCSESELTKAEKRHLACVREAEERTRLAAGKPLQICDAVNNLVVKCGQHVQKCYSVEEYR